MKCKQCGNELSTATWKLNDYPPKMESWCWKCMLDEQQQRIADAKELLHRVAIQEKPLCDRHNSDVCDCLGDAIRAYFEEERHD